MTQLHSGWHTLAAAAAARLHAGTSCAVEQDLRDRSTHERFVGSRSGFHGCTRRRALRAAIEQRSYGCRACESRPVPHGRGFQTEDPRTRRSDQARWFVARRQQRRDDKLTKGRYSCSEKKSNVWLSASSKNAKRRRNTGHQRVLRRVCLRKATGLRTYPQI